MNENGVFSTASFRPQSFKPHGTIESRIEGRLFIQNATGPFNKEILLAMDAIHTQAREFLASQGPWGGLFVFKSSALASQEMLEGLKNYLSLQVNNKHGSVATALVLAPNVEGASLMTQHYLDAWRSAGIPCEKFENYEDAHRWVALQLASNGEGSKC